MRAQAQRRIAITLRETIVAKLSILVLRRRIKRASSIGNICLVLVLIAVTAFSVSLSSAPLSYSQQKQPWIIRNDESKVDNRDRID
jgi:hypothetical protein